MSHSSESFENISDDHKQHDLDDIVLITCEEYSVTISKIEEDVISSVENAEELRKAIVGNKNNLEAIIKILEDIRFDSD